METVRFKQMTKGKKPAIYASQGDTGRRLQVKTDLTQEELRSFSTIQLEGTKPNGGLYSEDVMRGLNGAVLITITEQMTNEPGVSRAQLVSYGPDGERMGSEQVQILVEPLGGVG